MTARWPWGCVGAALLSLLAIGCGDDAPGVRPEEPPPSAPAIPPGKLPEQLVSEEGLGRLRVGGSVDARGDLRAHRLKDAQGGGGCTLFRPGPLYPSIRLVPSGHGRFHDYTEVCAFADEGTIHTLVVSREPRTRDQWPVQGRVPDWEGRELRLFRLAEGPRGVTYQVVDSLGYAVGLLACAGTPDLDLFRDGLLWRVHFPHAAPPPPPAAVDPAAFDRLLEAGDPEGAARVLARLAADPARERALLERGGLGPYALYAAARAAGLPPATPPALADDTRKVLWELWREQWRLVRALEGGKVLGIEWEIHLGMLQTGLPQYSGPGTQINRLGGRQLNLAPDHRAQVDELARAAARALFSAAGPPRYDALLAGLLRRTSWDLAACQRLFYESLPEGAHPQANPGAARLVQLEAELNRAWRRGGPTKLDALARYLQQAAECLPDAAAREANRRAKLLRLANAPDSYANWFVRVRGAPPASDTVSDPELLDWLPAPTLAEVRERLARIAASDRTLPQTAAENEYLLDFDRSPDLGAWWGFANVRDGIDAPRFEAADKGRQALRRYFKAIVDAQVEGERAIAKARDLKRAACAAYARHYGPEATALFLCLDPDFDFGDPARAALPPQWVAHVLEARHAKAHERPAVDAGSDAHAGLRAFLTLATRYRSDARRAKNPLVRLLQDRHMRTLASQILSQHREEAYVHVFLPGAQNGLADLELLNRWCNHGVANKALVDHYAHSATVVLRRDAGPLGAINMTIVGPGKRGQWLGDRLAIEPTAGRDVGGKYSYEALLQGTATARGELEIPPATAGDRRHRIVTLTISGP